MELNNPVFINFDGTIKYDSDDKPISAGIGYKISTYSIGVLHKEGRQLDEFDTIDYVEAVALLEAVKKLSNLPYTINSLCIQGDSQNVIRMVNPNLKDSPSNQKIKEIISKIRFLLDNFENITYKEITTRFENKSAHRLANDPFR